MNQRRWSRQLSRRRTVPSVDPDLARAKAVAWAAAVLDDGEAVFFDTETTGFPPAAEIIDVAVVSASGRVLVDSLIRPVRPIPPDSTKIHGITDRDVAGAPAWIDMHGMLCEVLHGRTVVVYNADFDRRTLLGCCDRHNLPPPEARWECAMRAYADYRGDRERRQAGSRWYRLDQAAGHFGYPPGGHRALADALTCLRVVRGIAGQA